MADQNMEGSIDLGYRQLCSDLTLQTKKQGFFKDFLATVSEKVTPQEFVDFSQLQDDLERVEFCRNLSAVHETIHIQQHFRTKSAEESDKKRDLGNDYFRQKDYAKALMMYSQAVISAPYPSSDKGLEGRQLALGLANRSAVLVHLKEFQLAISDIQLALQNGYPESQKYKLYERMAFCYKNLKDSQKALLNLRISMQCLDQSDLSQEKRETWKTNIDSSISKLENEKPQSGDKKELKNSNCLPKLYRGSNPLLPNASAAVSLEFQPEMGRFAKANEEIKPGQTIAAEKPYAACLLPEKYGTHCQHCFVRLIASVGCLHCRSVAFCSISCRDEALNTYHKYECPVLDILIASGMSILSFVAMRIITQQSAEFFAACRTKLSPDETTVVPDTKNVFDAESYTSVYNLVTLSHLRSPKDFFDRTMMAIFLLKCLQKTDYFGSHLGNSTSSEMEKYIGSLLLRHLQQLQFNAHEIHEFVQPDVGNVRRSKSSYIGVGIYPTVAFFNHSCYPAVTRYFIGSSVVICSNRTIRKGEMVAENYGPIFTHKSLKERQMSLKGRYWFSCKCQACVEDWGTYDFLPPLEISMPASCIYCDGSIKIAPEKAKLPYVKCLTCKKQMQTAMAKKKITELSTLYQAAFEAMDKAETRKAVQLFSLFINNVESLAQPPIRELHLAQEALRLCLAAYGTTFCPATHPTAASKS